MILRWEPAWRGRPTAWHHNMARWNQWFLGAVVLAGGGCAAPTATKSFPTRILHADDAYRQAHAVFEQAVFYKPYEAEVEPLVLAMVPLLVQEVRGEPSPAAMSGLGIVFRNSDGALRVDESQPVVYTEMGSAFVGGAIRPQTVLAWCQEVAISDDSFEVVCRGIRVTHDSQGYPLCWEVLDPKWQGCAIYVSETVESRAREFYGKPLAGRRYSVERTTNQEFGAVVPRVLSDGPIPMGPFVYLDASRGEATTVLCRCMASQVNHFTETRKYRVLPLAELGDLGRALTNSDHSLSQRLRWPDGIE